jgi:hypothetical protein
MNAAIELELRKQKKGFLSALLMFGISITWVAAMLAVQHLRIWLWGADNPFEVMRGALAGTLLFGIPLASILFPAGAAMMLRNSSNSNAEEPLPISPIRRVASAYLISLLYFVSFTVLILFIAAAFHAFSFFGDYEDLSNRVLLIALALLHLHFLTFVFCYWLKMPILGIGVALIILAAEGFSIFHLTPLLNWLYWRYQARSTFESLFWKWVLPEYALSLIGFPAALWFLSNKLEHSEKAGWRNSFLVLAGLLCGCAALWGSLLYAGSRIEKSLYSTWNHPFFFFLKDPVHHREMQNAIFQTAAGSLLSIDEKGRRLLIHRGNEFSILHPDSAQMDFFLNNNLFIEEDGSMWLLMHSNRAAQLDVYVLEHAQPGGMLLPYTSFRITDVTPFALWRGQNAVLLYGRTQAGELASASIPTQGKPPQWTIGSKIKTGVIVASLEERLQPEYQKGRLARMSEDRTKLMAIFNGKAKVWQLPGIGFALVSSSLFIPPAYADINGASFLLPVSDEHSLRLLLCKADGSISSPWTITFPALAPIRDQSSIRYRPLAAEGGVWTYGSIEDFRTLFAVSGSGHFYPALDLLELFKSAKIRNPTSLTVIRMIGTEINLLADGNLLRVDLNSGKLLTSPLNLGNGQARSYQPTKEGIYFVDENRIRLARWNGIITDLGPAEL